MKFHSYCLPNYFTTLVHGCSSIDLWMKTLTLFCLAPSDSDGRWLSTLPHSPPCRLTPEVFALWGQSWNIIPDTSNTMQKIFVSNDRESVCGEIMFLLRGTVRGGDEPPSDGNSMTNKQFFGYDLQENFCQLNWWQLNEIHWWQSNDKPVERAAKMGVFLDIFFFCLLEKEPDSLSQVTNTQSTKDGDCHRS